MSEGKNRPFAASDYVPHALCCARMKFYLFVIPPLCKICELLVLRVGLKTTALMCSMMETYFERKKGSRHLWKCQCIWQDKTDPQVHSSYIHYRAEHYYVPSGRHNYCNSVQFGCSHIGDGTEAITAGGLLTSQRVFSAFHFLSFGLFLQAQGLAA